MKTATIHKPSLKIARKIISIVDQGLVKGVGKPVAGQLCIEAAICLAYGLPHGDNPPCVGTVVRSFKISLNDSNWSSDSARAKGMRKLSIAQLGSDTIDQNIFVKELALATIRKIVPLALRTAGRANPSHKDSLEKHAKSCETVGDDLKAASYAAGAAGAAASAASAARAARAASAASYAAGAASYAAGAASYAASAASAARAVRAVRAASYAAGAAGAAASAAIKDEVLTLMADIGLDALIKCGSPGCKWLFLCDEKSVNKTRK